MRSADSIVKKTWELIGPFLETSGFELVEVEFIFEKGSWILRLYVDREGGVTLNDCASISEEIGHLLDVEDYVDRSYNLEVSSPGLNRPIRKARDFERFKGQKVKVVMKAPVCGRRNFTGILQGTEGSNVLVDIGGERFTLELNGVKKASLVYDFSLTGKKRG